MASPEFDALVAQAKANEDAEDAAVVLIQAIATKLADLAAQLAASPTAAAITQLAADLKAHADALGAAVVANTAPPPTP